MATDMTTTLPQIALPPSFYWWHKRLLAELARLERIGESSYNVLGLASNLEFISIDVTRYLDALEAWGMVERAAPRWDAGPNNPWFQLTYLGRRVVG